MGIGGNWFKILLTQSRLDPGFSVFSELINYLALVIASSLSLPLTSDPISDLSDLFH